MLRVSLGVNLPVHPPESTNESNKNASCGETDTSSQRRWQQHIKIPLCKTTFIKTLTDIIACLTYGAIKRSLPHSIFGPFSWLNHQFRICQTSLCRLRASPWFHLLCINKRALASASPHTTKSFVPLHSKFCSFECLKKKLHTTATWLSCYAQTESRCIGIRSGVWPNLKHSWWITPAYNQTWFCLFLSPTQVCSVLTAAVLPEWCAVPRHTNCPTAQCLVLLQRSATKGRFIMNAGRALFSLSLTRCDSKS